MKIKRLASIKDLYFYNVFGVVCDRFDPERASAISETPLPQRSSGRCARHMPRLTNLKRGDQVEVAILDPIFPGICTYITDRTTYMPMKIAAMARQDKKRGREFGWLTFLRPDGSFLFVIGHETCLAKDARRKE